MEKILQDFQDGLIAALPRLRRFAYALTGSMADADDLTQATVERALLKRSMLREGSNPDGWLFKICRNIWIDEIRRKTARREVAETSEKDEPMVDGNKVMEDRLEVARIEEVLKSMPDDQRAVIFLVAAEGYTYREAAEIMGCPTGTIMSKLARARGRITDILLSKEAKS
ncbi:MAG: RNA polymerase sigma factor [Alphaproteobacteria bacterium]|nr:MAG: RNA polymerase sigma factor [Alphaproteobacteria bacterium]